MERLHLKRRRVGRLADDAVEQVRVPVVEARPDAALGGVKRIRRHVEPLVNRVYYLATRVPLATLIIIIIITRLRRFRRVGEVRAEALEEDAGEFRVRGRRLRQRVRRRRRLEIVAVGTPRRRGPPPRGLLLLVLRPRVRVSSHEDGARGGDDHRADGEVRAEEAARAEPGEGHLALRVDARATLADDEIHHRRAHARGDDAHGDALERAGVHDEAALGLDAPDRGLAGERGEEARDERRAPAVAHADDARRGVPAPDPEVVHAALAVHGEVRVRERRRGGGGVRSDAPGASGARRRRRPRGEGAREGRGGGGDAAGVDDAGSLATGGDVRDGDLGGGARGRRERRRRATRAPREGARSRAGGARARSRTTSARCPTARGVDVPKARVEDAVIQTTRPKEPEGTSGEYHNVMSSRDSAPATNLPASSTPAQSVSRAIG